MTKAKAGAAMTADQVRKIVQEVLDARKSEIEELVTRAAQRAVIETLTALGVDTKNPIEAQSQFAAVRGLVKTFSDAEFQADLMHMRAMRRNIDRVKSNGLTIVLGILLTAVVAWTATGFRFSITR